MDRVQAQIKIEIESKWPYLLLGTDAWKMLSSVQRVPDAPDHGIGVCGAGHILLPATIARVLSPVLSLAFHHVSGPKPTHVRACVECVLVCVDADGSLCMHTNTHAHARTHQVLTGDSWASGVSRSIFKDGETETDVAFFFISYILIASIMLLNVVVAGTSPSLQESDTDMSVQECLKVTDSPSLPHLFLSTRQCCWTSSSIT
jgi:hypothetical protein